MGDFPSLDFLRLLRQLDVSHNSLMGPLPMSAFERLSSLVDLKLSFNPITGPIPGARPL